MKTIEPVNIWDNGVVKEATILNAYATNVTLGTSATFWYGLFSQNIDGNLGDQLVTGNLVMTGEAYTQWEVDSYAWDWVAAQLNLTIVGPYVPTTTTTTTEVPVTTTSSTTTEAPSTTSTTTTKKA